MNWDVICGCMQIKKTTVIYVQIIFTGKVGRKKKRLQGLWKSQLEIYNEQNSNVAVILEEAFKLWFSLCLNLSLSLSS